MAINGNKPKKKKITPQYIFRGKSSKKNKNTSRQLIEAIIMLAIGINLLVFLNKLPGDFILGQFLSDIGLDISQSLYQLFEILSKVGAAVIILVLLISSLFLLIGGTLRLIRVVIITTRTKTKLKKD